jgi:predicted Ser/Thr protein kinase
LRIAECACLPAGRECGIGVRREEFQIVETVSQGNAFGKPDLNKVEVEGRTLMVKDVRRKSFPLRWSLGLWLIHKEWKIYSRLKGLEGIPMPIKRIDRLAFAMEYVQGRPVERGESLPDTFFNDLERILKELHARGVVHMDLRHKGNILVSERGKPILIDFNSSFSFHEKGLLRRFLFPLLRWVDYGGLLKLKQRVSPASMTSTELAFLKRFNILRKLWIFN